MAAKVTNTASVTLLATEDSTQNVPINRGYQPSYDAAFANYNAYYQVPTVGVQLVPVGFTVLQLWVRNLNAPGGASISIGITPLNGVPTFIVLAPGDCFLYWCTNTAGPSQNGVNPGLSSIGISSQTAGCVAEYFIGA